MVTIEHPQGLASIDDDATIRVWDLPLRTFHWLLVGSVVVAFVTAEEEGGMAAYHEAAGWTVAGLIMFRVAWGFIGGEHARFRAFGGILHLPAHVGALVRGRPSPTVGHNPLGLVAIVAIVGLLIGVVLSGLSSLGGEDVHEGLANLLLGLLAVHVAGVVLTSIATKENLTAAMITGRKLAARHPGVAHARKPGKFALPLSIMVIGGVVYGLIAWGPPIALPTISSSGIAIDNQGYGEDDD